eukprot:143537-Amphidinium_carterae.2
MEPLLSAFTGLSYASAQFVEGVLALVSIGYVSCLASTVVARLLNCEIRARLTTAGYSLFWRWVAGHHSDNASPVWTSFVLLAPTKVVYKVVGVSQAQPSQRSQDHVSW